MNLAKLKTNTLMSSDHSLNHSLNHSQTPNLPNRMTWLGYLLIFAIPILVCLYYFSAATTFGQIVAGSLAMNLRKNGVELEIVAPELRGLTLSGQKAHFSIQGTPLNLTTESLTLQSSLWSILGGGYNGELLTTLYGGKVNASFKMSPTTPADIYNLKAEQVDLAQDPLLSSLGFSAGNLKLDLANLQLSDNQLTGGRLKFIIDNLTRSRKNTIVSTEFIPGTTLRLTLVNQVLNFALPTSSTLDAELNLDISAQSATIKSASIKLDIGTVTALGTIKHNLPNQPTTINITGTLTEKGRQLYGPLIAQILGQTLRQPRASNNAISTFQGTLSGPLRNLRWTWKTAH